MSLVFFGSGPVAAQSLELLAKDFTVEAVITKPRPAHHKGDVPVLDLYEKRGAAQLGQLHTVSSKAELSELLTAKKFSSQLGVVIDFGIIISQDVIDAFPLGIINSHFSLLPEWRGADPITFSILSGQKQTGVSLMRITAGLDEGPLLATGIYDIKSSDTTPSLTDELIRLSNGLLAQELPRYIENPNLVLSQEEVARASNRPAEPTYSRKLTKVDGILDFTKPAVQLEREVRAYYGWPGSRTQLGGKDVVITATHVASTADAAGGGEATPGEAGAIWRSGKEFGFYTSDGVLVVDKLKPAGKQEMSGAAFLNGYGNQLAS